MVPRVAAHADAQDEGTLKLVQDWSTDQQLSTLRCACAAEIVISDGIALHVALVTGEGRH